MTLPSELVFPLASPSSSRPLSSQPSHLIPPTPGLKNTLCLRKICRPRLLSARPENVALESERGGGKKESIVAVFMAGEVTCQGEGSCQCFSFVIKIWTATVFAGDDGKIDSISLPKSGTPAGRTLPAQLGIAFKNNFTQNNSTPTHTDPDKKPVLTSKSESLFKPLGKNCGAFSGCGAENAPRSI